MARLGCPGRIEIGMSNNSAAPGEHRCLYDHPPGDQEVGGAGVNESVMMPVYRGISIAQTRTPLRPPREAVPECCQRRTETGS